MTTLLDDLAELTGVVGAGEVVGLEDGGPSPAVADRPDQILVGGLILRYALSLELLGAAGELTVSELVARLTGAGFRVEGRASKAVSDALRWEVGHGRVVRVGRGRYRTGHLPRSTVWWLQKRLERFRLDCLRVGSG